MKNKLKEEMLKEIFIQTGGRPENIKIADVCAEIAVKAISSNTMLAVSLPSDRESVSKFLELNKKYPIEIAVYKMLEWREGNDR